MEMLNYLRLTTAGLLFSFIAHSTCQQGHLRPLGHQGAERHEIETAAFTPSGRDFYRKYIRKSKPVLFRNAVLLWPAFKNWNNITYLKSNYGKDIFNIDLAKKFKQQKIGQKLLELEKFLEIYKVEDVCLESNISESGMIREIHLPTLLQCEELHPEPENINIVMTSGDIVTPLYQVQADVLRISLSGTSKVLLFDKTYTKNLYTEDHILAPYASNVIPDAVDLKIFPEFSEMPYHIAELQPGDLLYIPKSWWMQATSSGHHRVGVNIWFHPFRHSETYFDVDEGKNIVEATELYEKFLNKQHEELECADRRTSLRHVLKINESDPETLRLRIPKKNERPSDVTLASGYTMPVIGLGTALLNESTTRAVKYALKIGYRLFDSAQGYPGSEEGIAMAIKESPVPRSEIFIVTKLHPRFLGYNTTLVAIDESLKRLETSYIDLFLIHSKECDDALLACKRGEPEGTWQQSWKAMEHAHRLGKIRSLGVSNFYVSDLKELIDLAEIPLSVVQNWFDPIHQDLKIRNFCNQHNIRYMGYSTLGGMWMQMGVEENPILTSSLLTDLSTHYDYVVSHVVLRWAIHKNITVIPRSSNENHIAQNFRSLDISLSEYDIKEVDSMASIMDDFLEDMFGKLETPQNNAGENASLDAEPEKVGANAGNDAENEVTQNNGAEEDSFDGEITGGTGEARNAETRKETSVDSNDDRTNEFKKDEIKERRSSEEFKGEL